MSMNPARSFGSALSAGVWKGWWIYFTGPPLGMLAATVTYVRLAGAHSVKCAKLNHGANERCIFRCGYRRSVLESSPEQRRELQSGKSSTEEEILQTREMDERTEDQNM